MTEKELKTKNEILEWIDKNVGYNYYMDDKYRNYFKKLNLERLNCSDRMRK